MKIVLIILGSLVVLAGGGALFGMVGLSDVKSLEIRDVDLTSLSDGVYAGKFSKSRWTYEVEVSVEDHKIIAIQTTGKQPDPGRRKIIDGAIAAIIQKQSPKIDVVSGATADTRAFQKSVENALRPIQ